MPIASDEVPVNDEVPNDDNIPPAQDIVRDIDQPMNEPGILTTASGRVVNRPLCYRDNN